MNLSLYLKRLDNLNGGSEVEIAVPRVLKIGVPFTAIDFLSWIVHPKGAERAEGSRSIPLFDEGSSIGSIIEIMVHGHVGQCAGADSY